MPKNGRERAYQWDLGQSWEKSLGLAGMGILVGALLFGSWNMPVKSFAHSAESERSLQMSDPPNFQKGGFADIAKRVTPAVVNITVSKQTAVPMSGMPFDPMQKFFEWPGVPGSPNSSRTRGSPRAHAGSPASATRGLARRGPTRHWLLGKRSTASRQDGI